MKKLFLEPAFSSPRGVFSPRSAVLSPRPVVLSPRRMTPVRLSPSKKQRHLNQSIELLAEKMSQAKARLAFDEKDRVGSIHEFDTVDKFKRIEKENRNLRSELSDLKSELESQKFNEKALQYMPALEKSTSFRMLSNEIEDLTKQLELRNLEKVYVEAKFEQNFAKLQVAYSQAVEKIAKFQKLVKLHEKKQTEGEKRKKEYKEEIRLKDLRIQDLERENEELRAKLNSRSVFGSMELNMSQLIAVQRENADLRIKTSILEKDLQALREKQGSFEKREGAERRTSASDRNPALEEISLLFLNNSRRGDRKMQGELRKNLKERFGEKFAEIIEKNVEKLNNAEIRGKRYLQALVSNIQREILLSEELKMALQMIFRTADDLAPISSVSEMPEETFLEVQRRLLNFKSNFNMRYLNLLQDINDRQFELGALQKEDEELGDFDEYVSLVKNNELIRAKLENLQILNAQFKARIEALEAEDSAGFPGGLFKPRKKATEKSNDFDRNSMISMLVTQAGVLESFINEKVE